jgi:hypothetical protein
LSGCIGNFDLFMSAKLSIRKELLSSITGVALLLFSTTCQERTKIETFVPASAAYGILAEKSLDLIASFNLDTWSTMLSDSVICYFPNGDMKTCTKLIGKNQVLAWGRDYMKSSGIKSMSIESAHYFPIEISSNRSEDMVGTQVIAYLSNKMVYESGAVSVRMNVLIHFDRHKMIDRYYTYYDNTPILNILNTTSAIE